MQSDLFKFWTWKFKKQRIYNHCKLYRSSLKIRGSYQNINWRNMCFSTLWNYSLVLTGKNVKHRYSTLSVPAFRKKKWDFYKICEHKDKAITVLTSRIRHLNFPPPMTKFFNSITRGQLHIAIQHGGCCRIRNTDLVAAVNYYKNYGLPLPVSPQNYCWYIINECCGSSRTFIVKCFILTLRQISL